MFLHSLLRFSASDAPAVFDGTATISHKTFFERSEAVALFLLANFKGSKAPVALHGDKENDMLVCIFGALKAGMPYAVIPCYYPEARKRSILSDCGASVLFNIAGTCIDCDDISVKTSADIDLFTEEFKGETVDTASYVSGDDDICLVYTSGSTGVPKGVRISHDNVVSRIKQMHDVLSPSLPENEQVRTVMFSSLAFSASFYNIYYMFAVNGVMLCNAPRAIVHEHARLSEYLLKINPHTLAGTPSMFRRLLLTKEFCRENFSALCAVTLGGEPFTHELAMLFKERFPTLALVNVYGMSELASGPMACVITDEILEKFSDVLPVGTPLEGCDAMIVDEHDSIVTDDLKTGELIIIGSCVSNGYYKRDELTSAYFFTAADNRRGYRTRDLVYRQDGLYFFAGRKDNRVKIGGNRIELEDVEANMKQIPIVYDCAACVQEKGEASLAAYVVKSDPSVSNMNAMLMIKKGLKERVESHMIPQKIIFTDELPKNINMKIDRVKLKKMVNEDA